MNLTISPTPSYPPLYTKLSSITSTRLSTRPLTFSKSHLSINPNTIRLSAGSADYPSLSSDRPTTSFDKVGEIVPKVESFFGHLCSQLDFVVSDFKAENCGALLDKVVGAVETRLRTQAVEVTLWGLVDLIGSFWPCSINEGYLLSTGSCGIHMQLRPGPMNMQSRKSRHVVSAFNDSRRGLPKKEEQKMMHEGLITESLPNGMFRVQLDNNDMIIGYISGKLRKNFIRILPGDRVKVEVSRYDSSRGRIIVRLRNKPPSE